MAYFQPRRRLFSPCQGAPPITRITLCETDEFDILIRAKIQALLLFAALGAAAHVGLRPTAATATEELHRPRAHAEPEAAQEDAAQLHRPLLEQRGSE